MIHCFILLTVSLLSAAVPRWAQSEEISLSYTASTLTFLAGRVAIDQGFFRQENLDVKFVQVRAAALTPALANGHLDYTMSFLPPIDSALRGSPVQMAGVFVDRSLHYLVTRSTIKSPADLRGKTFVINAVDLNGSTGLVFQAVARHYNLEIGKDVKWISAADSPALFAMVQQGIADATFLVPPWPQKARGAGMNVLLRAGDVYSAMLGGISTHRKTIRENPDQVRRVLRALIRASRFMAQPANEAATVASVVQWLKMSKEEAAGALRDVAFAYTEGVPRNEKVFWETVSQRAKLLSSNVALSEVADFTLAKEIRGK